MLLAGRTVTLALGARWFVWYVAVFLVGGGVFALFGLEGTVVDGYRGFARAVAGLVHLSLVIVPIMALLPAIGVIADDRESGELEYTLAQPVTFGDVYVGKWIGTLVAVTLTVMIGFAAMAGLAVIRGMPARVATGLLVFVMLIAMVFVSTGCAIAALIPSRARAMSVGLILWLTLVALGTLGIIAMFIRMGLSSTVLVAWSLFNPVEAFRLGVVSLLDADLSVLGPIGAQVLNRVGSQGTVVLAALTLLAWTLLPAGLGWLVFRRSGAMSG